MRRTVPMWIRGLAVLGVLAGALCIPALGGEARELFQEAGDPAGESRALLEIGLSRLELGEYKQALAHLEEALAKAELSGSLAAEIESRSQLGVALQSLGRVDEARHQHLLAVEGARRTDDQRLLALALRNLGEFQFGVGEVRQALTGLQEALGVARESGNLREVEIALVDLGAVHRHLGRSGAALDYYREALELSRQLVDVRTEGILLNNLGVVYRARGDIQGALDAYKGSVRLTRTTGNRLAEAIALGNLGVLYSFLGEAERAGEYYGRALALYRQMESPGGVAKTQMKIGWFRETWGDRQEAIAAYTEALSTSRQVGDRATERYALEGMGRVLLDFAEPGKALDVLRQALALHEQFRDLAGQMEAHRALGNAYRQRHEFLKARTAFDRSLELGETLGDAARQSATLAGLARLERDGGDLLQARKQIETVLATLESLRGEILGPDLRASFLARGHEYYRFYVDLLMRLEAEFPGQGFDQRAFKASERARARSLMDLLAEAGSDVERGLPPELAEQRGELTGRLSWLQRRLPRALAAAQPDESKVDSLRRELAATRLALEDLETEIRRQNPRYAEMRYPTTLGAAQVRQLLDGDTALLEYCLGAERSFLFVVTREDLAVFVLPPQAVIAQSARRLREGLRAPGRRTLGRVTQASRELYRLLIQPGVEILNGKQNLIVVPDGELHYLPFEVLRAGQPMGGGNSPAAAPEYLLNRWNVTYAPSASTLASLRRPPASQVASAPAMEFVAFADPSFDRAGSSQPGVGEAPAESLEAVVTRNFGGLGPLRGTRQEVSSIAELFHPEKVTLYLGTEASEEALKGSDAVSRARWLHFATHGLLDERQPAYSAVLMAASEEGAEDGFLQTHEVFGLDLNAELVVLSGCDTGLGKRVRGEGLVGLTRAFLYAGAQSILVSLWQVADQPTAELMVLVYRNLAAGREKAEAIRLAKLELLRRNPASHPYYWSSFILVGSQA